MIRRNFYLQVLTALQNVVKCITDYCKCLRNKYPKEAGLSDEKYICSSVSGLIHS